MEARGQGVGVGVGYDCEEVMSRARGGVLASQGTISAFVFLGAIVFGIGYFEDKVGKGLPASVRGCLHRLEVKVVGHRNGSQGWFMTGQGVPRVGYSWEGGWDGL